MRIKQLEADNTMWAMKILGVDEPKPVEPIEEFYGQESIKSQVVPFLSEEKFPPVFLFGEPGMGKTRFAKWIAYQRNEPIEILMCPVSERTPLPRSGSVLFDELHLLKQPEWLFGLMEERKLSIMGATSMPHRVEKALKSRFVMHLYMGPYEESSMKELVLNHLPGLDDNIATLYAGASAGNPRQAMRIVETAKVIGADNPEHVLSACRITADGINEFQLRMLETLTGNPMGLEQVALLMYADKDSVQRAERGLIALGLVELTSNGRKLTNDGISYTKTMRKFH